MAFGKRGRPPEDRLLRQREVYLAVAPLLIERGVERLSMREAAQAACLSVGGLYHLFASKRELAPHGLNTAALSRFCDDDMATFAQLRWSAPARYLEGMCEHALNLTLFARPSFAAAIQLGLPTLQASIDDALSRMLPETREAFGPYMMDQPAKACDDLCHAYFRVILGAVIDPSVTHDQLRRQLWALVSSYLPHPTRISIEPSIGA
ncbi:MAG TPA: helix-turn-helix domain-containing protein [Ktedonobacterales bacterium]|nr:helix-turn-helix domain-containing protein [Ktedonobacterales bacterium]